MFIKMSPWFNPTVRRLIFRPKDPVVHHATGTACNCSMLLIGLYHMHVFARYHEGKDNFDIDSRKLSFGEFRSAFNC